MVSVDLPHVKPERDRHGRIAYWYFRRNGRRWRLPGEPLSEEFMEEYRRLLKETEPREPDVEAPIDPQRYPPRSFGRLISEYLDSAAFKTNLRKRTKAEYRRVLEGLQLAHGHKPVALMKRRHIRKMRDARAETPGAANTILRMLKVILNFAVEEEWIDASPAAKMKELKVGEWRAWTDEECVQYEARWAPGTMQRRAYALALYTGRRKQDQITRTRNNRRDGGICVVQSKTGEELWIPEHSELTAELGRGVVSFDTLLAVR